MLNVTLATSETSSPRRAVLRRWAPAAVLAFGSTLAACGGETGGDAADPGEADASAANQPAADGGGGGTGGLDDFCLVSADDVGAAIETDVADAVSTEIPGVGGGCVYNSSAGVPLFSLNVLSTGGAPIFDSVAESAEPLSGIGDRAYIVQGGGLWSLAFMKGDVLVTVAPISGDLLDADADRNRAATEEIARKAADAM